MEHVSQTPLLPGRINRSRHVTRGPVNTSSTCWGRVDHVQHLAVILSAGYRSNTSISGYGLVCFGWCKPRRVGAAVRLVAGPREVAGRCDGQPHGGGRCSAGSARSPTTICALLVEGFYVSCGGYSWRTSHCTSFLIINSRLPVLLTGCSSPALDSLAALSERWMVKKCWTESGLRDGSRRWQPSSSASAT